MLRSLFAFLDTLSDLIADRAREVFAYATAHPGRRPPPAPPLLPPVGGTRAAGEESSPPDA